MTKIALIAKLSVDESLAADFEAALAQLIDTANTEEGLEIYAAHRDTNDASVYYFYELYTDADALGAHGKGDAMKAAMGALRPFMTGRAEVTTLAPVVAKGLDF